MANRVSVGDARGFQSAQAVGPACLIACALLLGACERSATPETGPSATAAEQAATSDAPGERVQPPFEVSGELEGLLMVWFDDAGQHTAKRRSEVPEAQRATVRIDSLSVPPSERLDPEHVYIADLRKPEADGRYAVYKRPRAFLDAHVDRLRPPPQAPSGDVTLYMASWCGACKAAASYLRSRDVPFVEKDIERDPAAAAEMQQKAQAAGKTPRGVPVIDFRGTLLLGFDQGALAALIDRAPKPI